MVGIFFFVGVMTCVYLYNEYLRVSQSVYDAHGDAAFEDDIRQYNREFVYNPYVVAGVSNKKVTDRYAPYNEEHKRILRREPGKKAKEICKSRSLIFAEGIYLYVDGKWTQRNLNVMVYGASGAGKTRGVILPNILQLLGGYIVVDSSGEIEQKTSGEGDFWRKSSQALLCCIIGYLVEVLPIEQRDFSNVLEILRMNNLDEHADEAMETDFDRLFQAPGDANPASYAYHQYLTFKKAPAKTALNILISTAVLIPIH